MTYKAHLENLFAIANEKANDFLSELNKDGDGSPERLDFLQSEWESAEDATIAFLDRIKADSIRVDDVMPD